MGNDPYDPHDADSIKEAMEKLGREARLDPAYREATKKRMEREYEEARKKSHSNGGGSTVGGCWLIPARFFWLGFVLLASLWGS